MANIHIEMGDITRFRVDAIVNAANNDLVMGGGVAGAIAQAGGPGIQEECSAHGPVGVGEAAVTSAGRLPARYIIHQASMRLGGRTTEESLRRSTQAVLDLAEEKGVRTLAFPAVGTGIAGFDTRQCARTMLEVIRRHAAGPSKITDIYFVLFDQGSFGIFLQEAGGLVNTKP